MIGSICLHEVAQIIDLLEPEMVIEVFVLVMEVRGDLMGTFGGDISELYWLQRKDIGPETLRSCYVQKYATMVAEDMQVEGFVSYRLGTLEDIPVHKDVVDDFVSPLVCGEVCKSMSVEACINKPTFAVKFGHAP